MKYRIVSPLIGMILLLTCALKVIALATGRIEGESFWNDRGFVASVAAFELVVGSLLLVSGHSRSSWLLAITCFTGFLGAALLQALAGESSCHCLGTISLNPWYMVGFDAVIVAALLIVGPGEPRRLSLSSYRRRLAVCGALILAAGIPSAFAVIGYRPAHLNGDGEIEGGGSVVKLTPSEWVGSPFPMRKHIDVGNQLEHGRWIVLFYHRDCPECRQAIPRYVALAHELANHVGTPRVALIEVPPVSDAPPKHSGALCVRGRLDDARQWRFRTPLAVGLNYGVVTAAVESPEPALRHPSAFTASPEQLAAAEAERGTSEASEFPDYRAIRRRMFLREIACGPLALVSVLQRIGLTLTPDDQEQLIAVAGSHGTDMLQLKSLAERHGAHGLGVTVSTAKLRQMGVPAIVHLDNCGFAAVTEYMPDGLRVVYPLQPPAIYPDDLFAKSFGENGRALLLSATPLSSQELGLGPPAPAPSGPHLRPAKSTLSVGRIHALEWQADLVLHNAGTEMLHIRGVKPVCAIVNSATVDDEFVAPGGTTILHARGKAFRLGGFDCGIAVETNQEGPATTIPVRGYVEQPVGFERPALMLQQFLPNRPAQAQVALEVSAAIDGRALTVRVPAKAPLDATIVQTAKGQQVLDIHWHGTPGLGWHRYELQVRVGETSAVPSPFQFAVEVVPEVEVQPPSLLIREEEFVKGWSRQVKFQFRIPFDGQFQIAWSDQDLQNRIEVETINVGKDTLELALAPSDIKMPLPRRRADLQLKLRDGTTYIVPVYLGEASLGMGEKISTTDRELLPSPMEVAN